MDRLSLAVLLLLAGATTAFAAVTPELERQVRTSTFEVVMKKPAEGAVQYEKPLPLELLPYIERTDPYRSIGTAFAIGPNTYVTAAHVLNAAIDSQYGAPALRASDGTVHAVAAIEKYSAAEDFVVFSIAGASSATPLDVNRAPHIDDPVLAVGNALGEGIVIRDGLFTSETPEQQDGRWEWIRFSAAASPGNSGGPLLDATGKVIGVVIAKSPNENLNYALPIANVLDGSPGKARFDVRILTKLPLAQGSRTYTLRDDFALPLSWEKFVRAYRSLTERHSREAQAELLAEYAPSMFPKGSGSDAILYSDDHSNRGPGLVIQRDDGAWATQWPDLQYTDLPDDGKVGIAVEGSAILLNLDRGNGARDDAFYANSKAFMDVSLKTLNLRRAVGTDQVRVVSLGAALTDVTTSDAYGRTWQLRVWPVPFMDLYLIAQLLPTPNGYVGLLEYAPSAGLDDVKAQLGLIADRVSVMYDGTLAQWQAFLRARALLPQSLRDVTLESGTAWTLHTRNFDSSVTRNLLKMDAQSELLMMMNYVYEGTRVVWDIASVWWYRDARESTYVGLWRQPRPPATATTDLRNRFEDLRTRHSPYDGVPIAASSDSFSATMSLQAPGSREGMAAADLAYGLMMCVDGHPSQQEFGLFESEALQGTRILERGAGPDVAASPPRTVESQWNVRLQVSEDLATRFDAVGPDIRGRRFSDDFADYIKPMYDELYRTPEGSASISELVQAFSDRTTSLSHYWTVAPAVVHNRDLWQPFLAHNHLPADTPHAAAVIAAESRFKELLSGDHPPTADWAASAQALENAYVDERRRMARKMQGSAAVATVYQKRNSICPPPAAQTSGNASPRAINLGSLAEFYPIDLRKQGLEGMVILSVKVDHSGCATDVGIAFSSGSDGFDQAALKWEETATFLPAEKDGKAVDSSLPLAVLFKLGD